ncbi:MAG: porin [Gammaproteobacteria bacterium]|nr:MAG: porin [Gammaproteobacteria bacterium]
MSRIVFQWLFLALIVSGASTLHAETSVNGYASLVAGKVTSGYAFMADYPKTGIYDSDISYSPDTSIGVQVSTDINENASFTIQLTADGASDFNSDISWAYLHYQLTPELSIQAGRKRLPLYYYSDFFDVGYAYYWIRPPGDNYTWQITHYNGVNLLYETNFKKYDISINLYTGREDSDNNPLLGYLSGEMVSETWKNMLGIVAEISSQGFELRATTNTSQLDRTINDNPVASDAKQQFRGLSLNFYPGNMLILSEFNKYKRPDSDIDITTNMISIGYSINEFTPHITRSHFKQEINTNGGDEEHRTTSYGIRWDLEKDIALKIQYDIVDDLGISTPVLGDSKAISMGIDIVF